jgi:hypothetical protein
MVRETSRSTADSYIKPNFCDLPSTTNLNKKQHPIKASKKSAAIFFGMGLFKP